MITLTINLIFIFVLIIVLLGINQLLSPRKPDSEKVSVYESGFQPLSDSRQKFNIQFYLVGILFIIFDLEVILLFPFGVTLYQNSIYGFWIIVLFIIILTIGYVYEYSKGALKFTRTPSNLNNNSSILGRNTPYRKRIKVLKRLYSTYSSSSSSKLEYWKNIKPLSNWYNINNNGKCNKYEQDWKDKSGIYVYRRKESSLDNVYVGTTNCLAKRFKSHRWHATSFSKGKSSSSPLFYQAVLKYGWSNFEIAVLELTSKDNLLKREFYYLIYKPCYNLIHVNEGLLQHSIETWIKISKSLIRERNPFIDKKYSQESKILISITKLGIKRKGIIDLNQKTEDIKKIGIQIYLFSSETKDLLISFDSASQTSKYFNKNANTILRYARNEQLFINKYILSLKNEFGSLNQNITNIIKQKGIPIYLFNIETKDLLNSFNTATEAGKHFNKSRTTILKYARNNNLFLNKYILSLKQDII